MKKILLSMAAVSVLSIGAPAAAQSWGGSQQNDGYGYRNVNANLGGRIGQLQARIQAGVQSGSISRQEAVTLRQQLRQLRDLERHYSVNGLTGREQADLQLRIRNLRQQIRYAEGGQGNYRDGGYDDDDYPRGRSADRWDDDRMDRDRDDYNDRDYDRGYDRDGRWDQDYDDDRSYGGTAGLRVGQRVSSGLYGVPTQYRDRYRDGGGVYYRSDGRAIYQIDARSQTVIRVYPLGR